MWITPIRIGSYLMIYWFGEMWIMWINKIFSPICQTEELKEVFPCHWSYITTLFTKSQSRIKISLQNMYFTYFFACLGGTLKLKKHHFSGYNPLAGTSTNSNPLNPSKTPIFPLFSHYPYSSHPPSNLPNYPLIRSSLMPLNLLSHSSHQILQNIIFHLYIDFLFRV